MAHMSEILESAVTAFLAAAKKHPNGTQEVADRIALTHYNARLFQDADSVLLEQRLREGFKAMAGREVRVDDMSTEGQNKWQASQPFNYGC